MSAENLAPHWDSIPGLSSTVIMDSINILAKCYKNTKCRAFTEATDHRYVTNIPSTVVNRCKLKCMIHEN
jgi:hypothetical protein